MRRTRTAIREAFRALIEEKGYDAVTIQDILERADVGRSTFYAHYRDKDDLLAKGFDDIRAALSAEHRDGGSGSPTGAGFLAPILTIFRHVDQYRHTWKPLVLKGGADTITRMLRDTSEDLIRRSLLEQPVRADQVEPVTQFLTGALMGLLTWWLDSQDPASAEQVHSMFVNFARRGVCLATGEPAQRSRPANRKTPPAAGSSRRSTA